MKPKVYVTRRLLPAGHEILDKSCDVEVNEQDQAPTKAEIIRKTKGKDGLLCLLTDTIDQETMDAEPNLKVISSLSVGFNHIDVSAATKRGIYVTFTPDVLTEATADFALALMLSISRRIPEADRYVREGKWRNAWSPTMFLGGEVQGRTLGIIGLGRIGRAVAKRAKGFEMRILYTDETRASETVEEELSSKYVSLDTLLQESDFVTIHVPLGENTHHLINEARLRMMKRSAYLVNTSRGSIVDEQALSKVLRDKMIAGAATDVWEQEPTPLNNPLLNLDNFIGVPHIASATFQARSMMSQLAATNLVAVLKGEMPPHLVNKYVLKIKPLSSTKIL